MHIYVPVTLTHTDKHLLWLQYGETRGPIFELQLQFIYKMIKKKDFETYSIDKNIT